MDVPTLITRIRAHVNVQDTVVLADADILEALNSAQERMVQGGSEWRDFENRFLFDYDTTTDGMVLPASLIKIAGAYQVIVDTDPSLSLSPIGQTSRDAWVDRATQTDSNDDYPVPSVSGNYFYLWSGKIYIVPQPGELTGFALDYYGAPPELTLLGPTAANYFTRRYFRCLFWGALVTVWDHLAEIERVGTASQMFEAVFDRAKAQETAYRSSGPKRTRGV